MREHGSRTRYINGPDELDRPKAETGKGCRCTRCRQANGTYAKFQSKRKRLESLGRTSGPWALPFVDPAEARAHLLALRRMGVGTRTVAERSGLARSALCLILTGETRVIRRETERRIFSVLPRDAKPRAYVPAGPTWRRINDLLAHGWTKTAIATALGSQSARPALQLSRGLVTAAHAKTIAELHERSLLRVLRDREIANDRQTQHRTRTGTNG